MANIPYLGSKISLITTSDIRYEGILYTLNREESTIAVQNVRSFGTEGRRRPEVPCSNEIYDFIIFRGKDLKDLTVLQASERPNNNMGVGSDYLDSSQSTGAMPNHTPPSNDWGAALSDSTYGQQSHQAHAPPNMGTAFQRPAAPMSSSIGNNPPGVAARNGGCFAGVPAPNNLLGNSFCTGGYPVPASTASRPPDKAHGVAALHQRPASVLQVQAEPMGMQVPNSSSSGAQAVYEDNNGLESARGTNEDAKSMAARASGDWKVPPRTSEVKDRPEDAKARGKGKPGAQKKTLAEVIRMHPRAQEIIVKAMRQQNSSNLSPSELRAMSESSPSVYHFCLDFVNYCCPSHTVSSDEQQWDMLSRALKKHFEKDFGGGPPQKPQAPARPNNTLGDFITLEAASKGAKKAPKVTRAPAVPRGKGTAGKKENGADELNGSEVPDDSAASTTWVCPRCTLRNENFLVECAACGTSKQQAALWAEFPPLG
mmetsp:Transcript_46735/g.111143  ORF Transcript_46735/g.111143 Transcript_46735/m.111143 type:complete len:484 (+) Transcript_46735:98-1549(+)